MKKIALGFALAIASFGMVQAQSFVQVPDVATKPLRFVSGAGVTYGGERIVTARYTNGDEMDIDGGGSVALLVGLDYRINPQFSVQGTIGYHVDNAAGSNGDIRFERVPFELLGYYHASDKVRVGGGLRYVTATSLRTNGVADIGNYEFKNTTSAVAEIEYLYSPQLGFKLRYVNDKFEEERSGVPVKGDHVGLLVNAYF
jgi:hypothetical protein